MLSLQRAQRNPVNVRAQVAWLAEHVARETAGAIFNGFRLRGQETTQK
jgi:hypothetical protein